MQNVYRYACIYVCLGLMRATCGCDMDDVSVGCLMWSVCAYEFSFDCFWLLWSILAKNLMQVLDQGSPRLVCMQNWPERGREREYNVGTDRISKFVFIFIRWWFLSFSPPKKAADYILSHSTGSGRDRIMNGVPGFLISTGRAVLLSSVTPLTCLCMAIWHSCLMDDDLSLFLCLISEIYLTR